MACVSGCAGDSHQCQLLTFVASALSSTIQRGSPSPHFAIMMQYSYSAENEWSCGLWQMCVRHAWTLASGTLSTATSGLAARRNYWKRKWIARKALRAKHWLLGEDSARTCYTWDDKQLCVAPYKKRYIWRIYSSVCWYYTNSFCLFLDMYHSTDAYSWKCLYSQGRTNVTLSDFNSGSTIR